MPASCPHCSGEITSLSGFVPQATHEERLKNQKESLVAENKLLKTENERLTPLATAAERTATELAEYRTKLERIETRSARTEQLRAAGLDEKLLESVEVLFQAARASADEGVDLAFDSWLQDEAGAKAHPLLRYAFQAPAGAGAGQPPPQARRTPEDAGRAPAMPSKLTPEQYRAELGKFDLADPKQREQRRARAEELKPLLFGSGSST